MIACLLRHPTGANIEIHMDPWLDWQGWVIDGHKLVVGPHRYAQLAWQLDAQQQVLETDPGPLDARVS